VDYFDKSLSGFFLRISQEGKKSFGVMYRKGGRLRRMKLGTYPLLTLAKARKEAAKTLRNAELGLDPAVEKQEARDVRAFLERKSATAPVGANRVRALLRKIYNWAISNEIVESNPVHLVPAPVREHQRERVLTKEEIKKIWNAIETDSKSADKKHMKVKMLSAGIMKLRLLTAQRGAEVMSMEWNEVDLETGWWTIPGEKTKNGLSHRVPLSTPALTIIRTMRSVTGKGQSTFVFPSPKGETHISNSQKPLVRIQKATGIDFVAHDFRRTAASVMTGMGIPRLTVKKILNHVEQEITAVYDRHSYDIEKREALETWAHRLMTVVSEKPAAQRTGA
jgi:integrase